MPFLQLHPIPTMLVFFSLLTPSISSAALSGLNLTGFGGAGIELNQGAMATGIVGASAAYAFGNEVELGIEGAARGPIATMGLDLNYYVTPEIFFGIQMGLDFDKKETTAYVGPQIGFDYPILPHFTIGPELQYLYTVRDIGGIVEILLTAKYYFGSP